MNSLEHSAVTYSSVTFFSFDFTSCILSCLFLSILFFKSFFSLQMGHRKVLHISHTIMIRYKEIKLCLNIASLFIARCLLLTQLFKFLQLVTLTFLSYSGQLIHQLEVQMVQKHNTHRVRQMKRVSHTEVIYFM